MKIHISDLEGLSYNVAPVDQGQTVEVGYADLVIKNIDDKGFAIVRRTYDQSDRTARYAIAWWGIVWDAIEVGSAEADELEYWCIANGTPPIPESCWEEFEH